MESAQPETPSRNEPRPSRASHALALKCGRQADMAEALDTHQGTVSLLIAGKLGASEAMRVRAYARYGIEPAWWDEDPLPPSAPLPELPPLAPVASMADARARTLALAGSLLAESDRIRRDVSDGDIGLRLKAMSALAANITTLARITGMALDLSEAQIVDSPAFKRVADRMFEAMRPHPEACRVLLAALRDESTPVEQDDNE